MKFGITLLERLSRREMEEPLDRQDARANLEKLGSAWIGPDVMIKEPAVILPGQTIEAYIVVSKSDLPPVEMSKGIFGALQWSTRSFYAQAGIDIIVPNDSMPDDILKDLRAGEKITVLINLQNYGQRPVEVSGSVMRFFYVNDKMRLRGEELQNAMRTGELKIEGKEGEDWYFGDPGREEFLGRDIGRYDANRTGMKNELSVIVHLRPQKYYIPPAPEPVRRDGNKNIRDDLADLLKPIPQGIRFDFEIRETPRIALGENIVGVIHTAQTDEGGKHIHSPLLDPGRTSWPIRTEVLNGLPYIEIFFYRK